MKWYISKNGEKHFISLKIAGNKGKMSSELEWMYCLQGIGRVEFFDGNL